ncbi:MAG: hypothetical protein WBM90_05815 [Acidimicrobiia bacterium]
MKLLVIAFVVAGAGLAAGFFAQNLWGDDPSVEGAAAVGAEVLDCPSGIILTSYAGGSRVFAMGRTPSGDWVQVRDLSSPDRTVWLSASEVELDADINGLPVAECPDTVGDVGALATTTTTIAGSTTTTIIESTTTSVESSTTTSKATTTTDRPTTSSSTTTTPPDTTPPEVKQPSLNPSEIWELDFPGLPCPAETPRVSTITAVVTDNGSVASVTASWTINGNQTMKVMSKSGNTYTATFGPYPYGTVPDNASQDFVITIRALDSSGNQASATRTLTLTSSGECLI